MLAAFALMVISCASIQAETDEGIQQLVAKIDTDVDPRFVYDYEKTKFAPPKDKTLLIMGQSVEAINEYLDSFPDEPMPSKRPSHRALARPESYPDIR